MSKYNEIKNAYEKHGFTFFTKPYSLNIFGVRANISEPNSFDDIIGVAFIDDSGLEQCFTFEATTDAGVSVLGNKYGGTNGTLIMIPGQYYSMFKVGRHKNKYPALVQNISIEVIRDNNKDGMLDFDALARDFGMFGLNLHHANTNENFPSVNVDNWSWGCQVIRKIDDWDFFWSVVKESESRYGDTFTYTLFDDKHYDNELIRGIK